MENISVLGDDGELHFSLLEQVRFEDCLLMSLCVRVAVAIKDELLVNGASVLPHKSISGSILTPSIVM